MKTAAVVPERLEDVRQRGQEEVLHVESLDAELPGGHAEREDDDGRDPVAHARVRRVLREDAARDGLNRGRARRSQPLLRGDQLAPRSPARPRRGGGGGRRRRARRSAAARACRRVARLREVDVDDPRDPARAAGDMTTTRVDRKTASEIECVTKTIGAAELRPRSGAARGSGARASSRRARRTARPSAAAAGENDSARAIETRCCIPPESCQGWWLSKPSARRARASRCTRSLRGGRGPSRASPAAARCSSPPCASRTGRRPGRRSRSRGRCRACCGRLAVHDDVARRRLDQVADDPQQRRLAAARRADQRDELAARRSRGRCPRAR